MAHFNLTPRYIVPELKDEEEKSVIYMIHSHGDKKDQKYVGRTRIGAGPVVLDEGLRRFTEHFKGIESIEDDDDAGGKIAYKYFRQFPIASLVIDIIAVVTSKDEVAEEDFCIRVMNTVWPNGLNMRNELADAGSAPTSRKRKAGTTDASAVAPSQSPEERLVAHALDWAFLLKDVPFKTRPGATSADGLMQCRAIRVDYNKYNTWCDLYGLKGKKKLIGTAKQVWWSTMSMFRARIQRRQEVEERLDITCCKFYEQFEGSDQENYYYFEQTICKLRRTPAAAGGGVLPTV